MKTVSYNMTLSHTVIIIMTIVLSYSPAQSQSTTAESVRDAEASAIPHLKSLLGDNYDADIGFNENLFKIPQLFNGQAGDSVLDEIVAQINISGVWENLAKDSFTYNNAMLVRYVITSEWNGTVWVNSIKFEFSYNSVGDITQIVFTLWANAAWLNISVNMVTYDESGNETEQLIQAWDGTGWVNLARISSTYSVLGLLDVAVAQDWTAGNWVNDSQLLYSYVAPENTLQEIIRQVWTMSLWVNDVLNAYTFDLNENVIEIEYFENGPSGDEGTLFLSRGTVTGLSKVAHAFFKKSRDVWVYSDPDFIEEFRAEKWIAPETAPGFWEDSLRTQWTLNSIGTILWGVTQLSIDNVWTNDFQITEISTVPGGNLQEVIIDIWNNDMWDSVFRSLYSYKLFVSVVHDEFTPDVFQLGQNYPNPFNPKTTIEFDLQRSGHTLLTVHNLKGEEVARLADGEMTAGTHSFIWDAARSASGVYFYQLKQNGIVSTKKMLLLK